MYVSELDRPWADTPFMLQGFHFESTAHGPTLQDHCASVRVTIDRSYNPGASVLARRFAPKQPKPLTRWASLQRWLRRKFGRDGKNRPAAFAQSAIVHSIAHSVGNSSVSCPPRQKSTWLTLVARILKLLASDVPGGDERRALDAEAIVVQHEGQVMLHERLQIARSSLDQTQEKFARVIDDLRRERKLQMSTVHDVVDGLVGIASEHPHALIWLSKLKSSATSSYEHAIEVSVYMVCLGQHLGYRRDQLQALGLAGLLQDVGYMSLPDGLLSTP
jgi:hypothetical protein